MKVQVLVVCVVLVAMVEGHGRLKKPPGRGTAWRVGFKTPPDYDDQSAFCGGIGVQKKNGGKCGICGDSYTDKTPRAHEHGGKYGRGVIVGKYSSGETIKVKIELTANHKGNFKFDLCKLDGGKETEECFQSLSTDAGESQVKVPRGKKLFNLMIKLPSVQCSQCVIRWTYTAGNNWGNVAQEQFKNCADISIQ